SSLTLRTTSSGRRMTVAVATIGDGCNAPFSPRRYSRTREWAPSVPINSLPVARVPSSKIAVAVFESDSTPTRRLPYWNPTVKHVLQSACRVTAWCIQPGFQRLLRLT
ncbi:hypothetical protein T310_9901, partial [Rasamsonia emersonii CBS 393.64]